MLTHPDFEFWFDPRFQLPTVVKEWCICVLCGDPLSSHDPIGFTQSEGGAGSSL
jgi:hypothetical protein